MIKSEHGTTPAYVTKDGSIIRELLHPSRYGPSLAMSLAEAVIPPGRRTRSHRHRSFQEIYHFLEGTGVMTLEGETFPVSEGDSVLIPAGSNHHVKNTGAVSLRFLCCCVPPYTHDETELIETD